MRLFPDCLRAGLAALLAVVCAATTVAREDVPHADFAQAHVNLGLALNSIGLREAAAAAFKKAIELDSKLARAHNNVGSALFDMGRVDEAMAEYKIAIELDPKESAPHTGLGNVLRDKGRLDEAIAEHKIAIQLEPEYALPHCNLGICLHDLSRLDEAMVKYKQAIKLDPKFALPHVCLGRALLDKGLVDEAIAEYKKAIKLDPEDALGHYGLGACLYDLHHWDEAIVEFKKAIELDPKVVMVRANLGYALLQKGQFTEARKAIQRCLELLPENDPFHPKVTKLLRECERMISFDGKLTAFLKGEERPANAAEQIEVAYLCRIRRRFAAAVRFYTAAFAAKTRWAEDLQSDLRYDAACSAVLAAAGQGEDAAKLDDNERARLRKQALDWLRDALILWIKQIEKGMPQERTEAQKTLRRWQRDPCLAGLRDAAALDKLPETERAACRKLWNDVAALLKK